MRPMSDRAVFDAVRLRPLLSATGPEIDRRSPLTGEPLGSLPTSTPDDIRAAAVGVRDVQTDWAARRVRERAAVLLQFHDYLLDHRDAFVDLLQLEGGKARLVATEEVLHVALTARYYGRTAARHLRPERGSGVFPLLTRIDRLFVAKGVVGVIAPWNYPLTMGVSDALAALVAGNGVLLKPDLQTPLAALAAIEGLRACGMPAPLWAVVLGAGDVVGPAVIDYVCFTGSTATGRSVAVRCAERLIGCSLELGGKNPLLVLADADVEKAAEGAVRACFANAGQLCVSTERIYVAEPLAQAFTEAFLRRTAALRLGGSLDFRHEMAGMINRAQLDRVGGHVENARSLGAVVLTGGHRRPDLGELYFEPTALSGVTAEMDCYAQETFGPLVSIYSVADDAEAVRRANDSAYGLNASVWTTDPVRGRAVAAQIRCGTVNVNEGYGATFASIDAPMGGMKASGLGRRQGREGIRRFVEVQSVGTQSGLPIAPSHGLGAQAFSTAMTGALRLLKRVGRA